MTRAIPQNRWNIAPFDAKRAGELGLKLDVPPLIAHLMLLRGLKTDQEMRDFLKPSLSHLSNPYDLDDMRPAVDRITRPARGNPCWSSVIMTWTASPARSSWPGDCADSVYSVDCDMPDRFARLRHHAGTRGRARERGFF